MDGKRTLAAIGICSLLFGNYGPPATAQAYPDVPSGQWFAEFVNYLTNQNVVTGYPNNEFRPHNDVTRAEFATMLAKSQGLSLAGGGATRFSDVSSLHWAAGAINAVASRGWIAGYPNGTFGPNQPITMAEMYTIVSKVHPTQPSDVSDILDRFSDGGSVPSWAQAPVAGAIQQGIYVREVTPNQIEPFVHASRADVSTTLAKVMNASFRTPLVATEPPDDDDDDGLRTRIVSRGVLFEQGDRWGIRAEDGEVYFLSAEYNLGQFDPGDYVHFVGIPLEGYRREVIRLVELLPIPGGGRPPAPGPRPPQRVINVEGRLQRTVEAGGWLLSETRGGRQFRLENISEYVNRPWFREGTRVRVQGRVLPDRPNIYMQGTRLRVISMQPRDTRPGPGPRPGPQITIDGRLQRTVEPGGWVVTDRRSGTKYLLLNIDRYESQRWFREGARIEATGRPEPDRPTTHMEGTPFHVTDLRRAR